MAGTKTPTRETAPPGAPDKAPDKAPEKAPADAPADQPIPARPAPRAKEAPRTMRELRESREGRAARRPAKTRPTRERAARRAPSRTRPGPVDPDVVRGDRGPRASQGHPGGLPPVADQPPAPRVRPAGTRTTAIRRRVVPGRGPQDAGGVQPGAAARRGCLALVQSSHPLPASRFRRPARFRRACGTTRRTRHDRGHARQPALLPRDAALAVRRDRRAARASRAGPRTTRRWLAADRHREAVRP